MKITNNELKEQVERIKKERQDYTKEEEQLLANLSQYIEDVIYNKTITSVVENDSRIDELLRTINEKLKELIEGNRSFDKPYLAKTLNTIDNLNGLKEKIHNFKKEHLIANKDKEFILIDKCVSALSNKPFGIPHYYGELIATRKNENKSDREYLLNEELIHKLNSFISQDNLLQELEEGTRLVSNEIGYNNKKEEYNKILGLKPFVYGFKDLIIEYNQTNKEIENVLSEKNKEKYINIELKESHISFIINRLESNPIKKLLYKKQLEDLKREEQELLKTKKEYKKIEKELNHLNGIKEEILSDLESCGVADISVLDIMEEFNKRQKRRTDDDKKSINNILKIMSEEDLDEYYSYVEKENNTNNELLEKVETEKEDFYNKANKKTIDLLEEDFYTAKSISMLNNTKNIDPKLIFFILELIITIRNLKTNDLIIDEETKELTQKMIEPVIVNRIKEFDTEYLEIMSNRVNRPRQMV